MLIKNWRPFWLINVDKKIASKTLAFRVRKVLPSLIYYDQIAYVKGRYIRESICDFLSIFAKNLIEWVLFIASDFAKGRRSHRSSFPSAIKESKFFFRKISMIRSKGDCHENLKSIFLVFFDLHCQHFVYEIYSDTSKKIFSETFWRYVFQTIENFLVAVFMVQYAFFLYCVYISRLQKHAHCC